MNIQETLFALAVFISFTAYIVSIENSTLIKETAVRHHDTENEIVITAPVQVLLYGGDKYLAANFETIRAATTAIDTSDSNLTLYRIRSHLVVSKLNPCNEDNYYLGNAVLSWGGATEYGNELLEKATACRFWDHVPAFFYGFNQYFFKHNIDAAKKYFEIAANRSPENAASFKKISIMITARQIDDARVARDYLRTEANNTSDKKLKKILARRIERVSGLILLQDALRIYEQKFNTPLPKIEDLISSKILTSIPIDPLGMGYELSDGRIQLRELKIQAMER